MKVEDFKVGKEYRRILRSKLSTPIGTIYKCTAKNKDYLTFTNVIGINYFTMCDDDEDIAYSPEAFEPVEPVEKEIKMRKWKIKQDLSLGSYGCQSVVTDMLQYKGETFECREYQLEGRGYIYKSYLWTREMVELVEPIEELKEETKTGDLIQFSGSRQYYKVVGFTTEGDLITHFDPIYDPEDFYVSSKVFIWKGDRKDFKKYTKSVKLESIELTLKQIADKFNINIEQLRIKGE